MKDLFSVRIIGKSKEADLNPDPQKYRGKPGIKVSKTGSVVFEYKVDPKDNDPESRDKKWIPSFDSGLMPKDMKFFSDMMWVDGYNPGATLLVLTRFGNNHIIKPLFTAPVFNQYGRKVSGKTEMHYRSESCLVIWVDKNGVAEVEEINAAALYDKVWLVRIEKLPNRGWPFIGGEDFLRTALPSEEVKKITHQLYTAYLISMGEKEYEDAFEDSRPPRPRPPAVEARPATAPVAEVKVTGDSEATTVVKEAETSEPSPPSISQLPSTAPRPQPKKVTFGKAPATIVIYDWQAEALIKDGITTVDELLEAATPRVEKLLRGYQSARLICSWAVDAQKRAKRRETQQISSSMAPSLPPVPKTEMESPSTKTVVVVVVAPETSSQFMAHINDDHFLREVMPQIRGVIPKKAEVLEDTFRSFNGDVDSLKSKLGAMGLGKRQIATVLEKLENTFEKLEPRV